MNEADKQYMTYEKHEELNDPDPHAELLQQIKGIIAWIFVVVATSMLFGAMVLK